MKVTFVLTLAAMATGAMAGSCECCGGGPLPDGCPTNGSKKRDMGYTLTHFPRQWIDSMRARSADAEPVPEPVVEVKN